jgi:hypothetical protein
VNSAIVARARRTAAAAFMAAAAGALLFPGAADAHALVGRQDLPIPAWLFAWGASLVLIVSFAALAASWRTARLQSEDWRPVSERLSGAIVNRGTELLAGAIGVFLFGLVVYSGLAGTEAPDRNFSLTFVFVTFVLGVVIASVLFGDVFRAFNPWRAIARAVSATFSRLAGGSAPAPLRYPEWLGVWPAVVGWVAFVWLELVYGRSGFATAGLAPRSLAIAVLIYTAITFVAMFLFGIETWVRKGETFSVYFRMFSRLSSLEVRDGRLGRRRLLSGTATWAVGPGSVALVLAAIGGTAFDGAQEGALNDPISSTFNWLLDRGVGATAAFRLSSTLFLLLTLLAVAVIYWAGVRGMQSVPGSPALRRLGRLFAHSFIPIALAYLTAHYFSLFVFQEQAQFTYLLSDPLGEGSDLFGTASSGIDYGVIGATAVWYVQVAALVVGHVTALALGHDRALVIYENPKIAARSQYWMLALMVAFTCLGLFLLSQANG